MHYSLEEKQRMDGLVAAFRDFIREQEYFDIVYSEKIGYFRIVVKEDGDDAVMRLESFDEMLKSLMDDMLMEIAEKASDSDKGMDYSMKDLERVHRKLMDICSLLGEDADLARKIVARRVTEWIEEYRERE